MTEKTDANSLGAALLDRNDGLPTTGLPFICLAYGMEEAAKHPTSSSRWRERAPDYQLVAAWAGFLLFIGAGAFALDTAIHNETLAAQHPPQPELIYRCRRLSPARK